MRTLPRVVYLALVAALLVATPALAQEKLKIGFITTLSGPQGVIGEDMKNSVELALDHLGRKVGGLDVEVIYGDDQVKPDVGKQLADEMLKKHKVNFVAGIIWSNVMLAVAPTVTGAGTFMIGTNAGPHELAGKGCHELFFTTSWQNDQTPEAMGKYMQDQGLNDVYLMAPNYAAGKDMLTGFKRYFKGRIVDEVYTRLGQTDYQAEISQLRSKNPKAVFVFYPGGMGIQFLKQYAQAACAVCSRGRRARRGGDSHPAPGVFEHARAGGIQTLPTLYEVRDELHVLDRRRRRQARHLDPAERLST